MTLSELLGSGIAAARHRKGWTQERTAQAFRDQGLQTWRKGTVGQMEVGLRHPGLDELLPICAALEVSLGQLLLMAGGDEPVRLGESTLMAPKEILARVLGADLCTLCTLCKACADQPPPGFTCNTCGRSGA